MMAHAMNATDYLLVLNTCPAEQAEMLATTIVEEHLAACVNRIPKAISTYRWQGDIKHETEFVLVIKTRRDRFSALRDRVAELHPYSVPEIIAVPFEDGIASYLGWIDESITMEIKE